MFNDTYDHIYDAVKDNSNGATIDPNLVYKIRLAIKSLNDLGISKNIDAEDEHLLADWVIKELLTSLGLRCVVSAYSDAMIRIGAGYCKPRPDVRKKKVARCAKC